MSVWRHLYASLEYQGRLARFIENHDEKRAVAAFGAERSRAVASVALLLPGLRLLHEGQLEGLRLKLPVQLGRRQPEPREPELEAFYRRLLAILRHPVFHDGDWQLLEPKEGWSGNPSHQNILAYRWVLGETRRLVVVNLASEPSQCFVRLDLAEISGRLWHLKDLLSEVQYTRDGDELSGQGLYLELPAYKYHVFDLRPAVA